MLFFDVFFCIFASCTHFSRFQVWHIFPWKMKPPVHISNHNYNDAFIFVQSNKLKYCTVCIYQRLTLRRQNRYYAHIFWSNTSIILSKAFVQFKEMDKSSADFIREVLKEINANNTEGRREPRWHEKGTLMGIADKIGCQENLCTVVFSKKLQITQCPSYMCTLHFI